MHGDLPGQVRRGFAKSVWPVRDSPHDGFTGLGTSPTSQRRGLTCLVCPLPLPTLRGDLDCGLPDPLRTLGAITQGRWYAIDSVAVLRRILGRVDPTGLRHHVRHLRCEPLVTAVRVDRCIRHDLRPIDRDRAEAG